MKNLHDDLKDVPSEVVAPGGDARLGTYRGSLRRVDWSDRLTGLTGVARRLARRKKWVWGGIATNEVFVGFAVVDVGYGSNAFAFAVDLERGGMLANESFLGRPGAGAFVGDRPGDGARAEFVNRKASLRIVHPEGTGQVLVELATPSLKLESILDRTQAPPPVAVVMKLAEGDTTATQKANLLAATGTLRADGRRFDLEGGFGGFDYTQGILGRRTAWRWAFGFGRSTSGVPVGFNLSDGLSQAPGAENVIWVGDELIKTDRARFVYDVNAPEGAWEITTEDGALTLRFTGRGTHREVRNLGIIRSRFLQVAGLFSGTVRTPRGEFEFEGLPGVTEDQFVVW